MWQVANSTKEYHVQDFVHAPHVSAAIACHGIAVNVYVLFKLYRMAPPPPPPPKKKEQSIFLGLSSLL